MRILMVNAGSTSLKLERYDLSLPLGAIAEPSNPTSTVETQSETAEEALAELLRDPLDAVAHRFVRMPDGTPPVLRLDAAANASIARAGRDAPLHDASALQIARIVAQLDSGVPQFAVSDSAFHRTMPDAATTYALPRELTRAGLRRIGYHGLSHEYAVHRGCRLAGIAVEGARVVTAHLGGGSSLCAIVAGRSLDTTMGYTPLEGLPMATRSGSVDPGLLIHLLRSGTTIGELEDMLERRSGLFGISGRSGDVRVLEAAHDSVDARLALDVLVWRLRSSLGAMIAVLGGLDLLVFTGGTGEHSATIRASALDGGLGFGAFVDADRNASNREGCIHSEASRAPVAIVQAREGWQLARSVAACEL